MIGLHTIITNKEKINKEIGKLFCEDGDYNNKVTEFVENADGDYVVQIYDQKIKKYLLFNDYLGRLPIYYHSTTNKIIISREIKFILEFMDEIKFDKMGLVENLMFGYTFGNRTHFQEIKRLYPSEYIICEEKENGFDFKIGKTAEFNFKTKKRFWSKKKSLQKLTTQFLKATKNRVTKLHEKGYKIISDLSGGYDSRAVIGALSKFDKNIDYYTYEYIQDESKVASKLFKSLNSPGKHIKTSFNNIVDYENISNLVFKTNGLVNYYTTGICYNDMRYLNSTLYEGKIAHLGGLRGEYIRHPQKRFYRSIYNSLKEKLYSTLSTDEATSIVDANYEDVIKEIYWHFYNYEERGKNDSLKHFYHEYGSNYSITGDERTRIFHWTVQPFISKEFLKIVFHQIPLKWTGYKYFIEFMKQIDVRLLNTEIYQSKINLKDKKSINKFERQYQKQFSKKIWFFNYLKHKFPSLIFLYQKIKKNKSKKDSTGVDNSQILELFNEYYNKLEKCYKLFDLKSVEKYIHKAGGEYNRLTTLVMYLYEIEKRYSNKIKIEEQ